MIRHLLNSLAMAALGLVCSSVVATGAAPAARLAPGDILFTEFFEGWHKLDPTTGQVTQLPWPMSSNFTRHIEFDVDGAILFDDFGGAIKRFNPTTGRTTNLNVPNLFQPDGFVVETNGDLLIANGGEISRFSRVWGTTSTVTGGSFFSPRGIARGADGRVFATEFFDDLWEIRLATGTRKLVTTTALSIPDSIAVRSDGDLIVENFSPSLLHRINPNTGAVSLFSSTLPTFVREYALDASDNLWLSSSDGIHKYPNTGGSGALIAGGTFFSPRAIAVVPANWTVPPVPEPSTFNITILAIVMATLRGRWRISICLSCTNFRRQLQMPARR